MDVRQILSGIKTLSGNRQWKAYTSIFSSKSKASEILWVNELIGKAVIYSSPRGKVEFLINDLRHFSINLVGEFDISMEKSTTSNWNQGLLTTYSDLPTKKLNDKNLWWLIQMHVFFQLLIFFSFYNSPHFLIRVSRIWLI